MMLRTFVTYILAASLLTSSLAFGNGPLISRSAIDAARNYVVTSGGVQLVGNGSMFSRTMLSNSKLYNAGVRNLRVVSHKGAEHLVLLNASNQVMKTLIFQPSTPAQLAKFKPSLLRKMLVPAEKVGSVGYKAGHIAYEKLKHFPIEAVAFSIAIGAITYFTLWQDQAKTNPMASRQYWDGTLDGHSQFSFYLFMVAAGWSTAPFEQMLGKDAKFLRHMLNYYGMTVGMLASHAYNDMMISPGMRECAWAGMSGDFRNVGTICDNAYTTYAASWRDPDKRSARFNEFTVAGINLITSAAAAAVTAWGVGKAVAWTGINIAMFFAPGGVIAQAPRVASFSFKLARSTLNATNFMVWTTFLEQPVHSLYQNFLHTGSELAQQTNCLGFLFERTSNKDRPRTGYMDRLADNYCEKPLVQYYNEFLKTSVRWRNENMSPVIMAQNSWQQHLAELATHYRTSEKFYRNITEALDAKYNNPDQSPLDKQMYYFGVTPQTYTDDVTPQRAAEIRRQREQAAAQFREELEREIGAPNPAILNGLLGEMIVQGDQTMPPTHRVPVTPTEPTVENRPEFSWGLYLLEDFKGLETDQDKHVKYVARAMYRTYIQLMKQKSGTAARALSDADIKVIRAILDMTDRERDRLDPFWRYRTTPLKEEIKLSDVELKALRELIKKLASPDRKVVGDGLMELYRSVSIQLTGNAVPAKERIVYSRTFTAFLDQVYRSLGQPLPMADPGRGFLSAWTLFQDESAKKLDEKPLETPFSRLNRNTLTLTAPEFLITAMVWGPEVKNREEIVALNRSGFKSTFHPPKLVPSGKVYVLNRLPSQPSDNSKRETIYTRRIWLDSDTTPGCNAKKTECYKPIIQWILDGSLRPEVANRTETQFVNNFGNWWETNVKPQYLEAWAHFEQNYESVIKLFLNVFYGEDRTWLVRYFKDQQHFLNPSDIKNGVLASLNQERQISMLMLGQVLGPIVGDPWRPKVVTRRAMEASIVKTVADQSGVAPFLQAYEDFWKNSVSLFLNMRIPLALVKNENENKFDSRVPNQGLVKAYEQLNKMVDEMEQRLEAWAKSDELGKLVESEQYQIAKSAMQSLRNSHDEMLDFGLIINSVSYVEQHEDRNNPVLRRCLRTGAQSAVPFGPGQKKQQTCP